MSDLERLIRERAYLLWEQAGCPPGSGEEFWFAASDEVAGAAGVAPLPTTLAELPPEAAAQHGTPGGMPGERVAEQGVLDDRLDALVVPATR